MKINPIPWQRTLRSGTRSFCTATRERLSFILALTQQHDSEPFFENPIHLDVIFYMPISKTSQKVKENSLYHTNVPHLDNLYKFLLQAMKDIVISDERVICSVSLKKVYDSEPRTELIITEVV